MDIEPGRRTTDVMDLRLTPSASATEVAQEIARLRADVAARLRHVCCDMRPEEFAGLVDDICELTGSLGPEVDVSARRLGARLVRSARWAVSVRRTHDRFLL